MSLRTVLACVVLSLFTANVSADLDEKIQAALNDSARPESDKARDKNRKPLETLKFFRLKEDMRVLELIPGGGWYTRILAPVLRDEGELFLAIANQQLQDGLLKQQGFDKVTVLPTVGEVSREGRRVEGITFEGEDMDLVLTFRNLHNLTEAGRAAMNTSSFEALKSGGYYGVIDHTRRHMQRDSDENWRRMDPVLMIKEIEAAGFEFVDYSNLHYRLDDELRFEVGRRTVSGNTDRFTLLFRKP